MLSLGWKAAKMNGHAVRTSPLERSASTRLTAALGALALAGALLVVGVAPSPAAAAEAPVPLGLAAPFAVLSGASVGNTVSAPADPHPTTLYGDLGVSAAAGAITGFPPGIVVGTQYPSGAAPVVSAHAAMVAAYDNAAARTSTAALAADLIGATVEPGVHRNAGAVGNTGTVTLDGLGLADSVFIFQVGGAFSMAAGAKVVLINGAQASNVFWQANGAGTLGAGAEFAGTLLALDAISVGALTSVNGRLLARTGAIALDGNYVYSNPPTLSIDGGDVASAVESAPAISGTTNATVGAVVTVTIGSQTLDATVQAGGTWTVTTAPLPDATYAVTASVSDDVGNVGTDTQNLTIDTVDPVVTIDGGATVTTNDPTPTITGATDVAAGRIVTVVIGSQTLTTLVQGGGQWNVTPTSLPDGLHAVSASVTDLAGNPGNASQSLTVDTAAPAITITGGPTALTNDPTPTITGTAADAGTSTVTVVVSGQTMTSPVLVGAWSVTAAALASSTHHVSASVTDPAGNTAAATQFLTVDTVAPSIAISGSAAALTNDSTPTITGSTSATAGTTVTVTVAGQTLTTLSQGDGTWNVTPNAIGDATHVVSASVTDPAGNTGTANQDLTVDTAAPAITIDGGPTALTNDATPTISGTSDAAPGTTVTLTVAGRTLTTLVQADGTWNITPATLADDTHPMTAGVTDPAGNAGSAAQQLTVDATPVVPEPPVTTPPPVTTAPPVTTPPVTTLPTAPPPPPVTSAPPAGFTAVGPKRLVDTRTGTDAGALLAVPKAKVGGPVELSIHVTDLPGIVPAAGVAAVSLNVTATGPEADGFVTVYACGAREPVSSVNFTSGSTVANAVVAPVSSAGMICIYSSAPTDIVIDINGWFAAGAALTPVGPTRVFDTRIGSASQLLRTVDATKIAAGEFIEVRFTDLGGIVPAGGVGAVSLNVTAADPDQAGFVTVYACGARETVSSVNFDAGQAVANAVIAPVSGDGTVCFYASATTHLIVDINGWLAIGAGFEAVDPRRLLDTRSGPDGSTLRQVAPHKIGGETILQVQVTDIAGVVPATAVGAVSLNVTVTNPEASGFLTIYACGAREEVSSVNYAAGQTVANAVIAPVSPSGEICIYSLAPTDVVVDVNGWFSSLPAA
jgi:hypothetical protein